MTSNFICMISDDIGTCLHAVYCRLKIRTYTQSISKLNLLRACLHAVYPLEKPRIMTPYMVTKRRGSSE